MKSNADFGMSLQKRICDRYGLKINERARSQFEEVYNPNYEVTIDEISTVIFERIKVKPKSLLTFTDYVANGKKTTSPHNFLLENGKTLSIRTTKSGDKVCPKVIGQPGKETFNEFFEDYYGERIETKEDVKKLVFNHIHEMLPVFIDNFFQSDITVIVTKMNKDNVFVYNIEDIGEYSFSRNELSFTKAPADWNESTTLKLNDKSIAEIQVHKSPNRFFKFRFIVSNMPLWFNQIKVNTETLGISAEAIICEHFKLQQPDSFRTRASRGLGKQMLPAIKRAFEEMPEPIKHSGSLPGTRGKNSKCSYDFILKGNETLSLKTNKGKMVCPPEVGQPGSDTCMFYFEPFFEKGTKVVTRENFKKMVFDNIEKIMPIYVDHMFDSDWLMWIYQVEDYFDYRVVRGTDIENIVWERDRFSFTKQTLEEWNESNTVKYDGNTIGEFQVHSNRNCFKFRFNLQNLLNIVHKKCVILEI